MNPLEKYLEHLTAENRKLDEQIASGATEIHIDEPNLVLYDEALTYAKSFTRVGKLAKHAAVHQPEMSDPSRYATLGNFIWLSFTESCDESVVANLCAERALCILELEDGPLHLTDRHGNLRTIAEAKAGLLALLESQP